LVDEVLIDRVNYQNKVKSVYRKAGWERYLEENYFLLVGRELKERFEGKGIEAEVLFE